MADSTQTTDSPPPKLREPVVGFISGQGYSVGTIGSTLRVELGTMSGGPSGPATHYHSGEPVITLEVSTPKEAAQLLLLTATIQRFINHLYPNGI